MHEIDKNIKQGMAKGSLNEFSQGNGGDDGEAFNPGLAKMAQEHGFTKGVSLADGASLATAFKITEWDQQFGGLYKQHFVQGFKEGRMDKINHNNKQYNLNLKLMKDGSIIRGEQGVAEGSLNEISKDTLKSYGKKAVADGQASQKRSQIEIGKAASTKDDETAKTHYDAANQAKDRTEKRMAGLNGAIKRLTKQGVAEAFENDESNMMYRFNSETGRLGQRMIHNNEEQVAHRQGYRDSHESALKVHGIIRSKFKPGKWVQKQGNSWAEVHPFGKPDGVDESATAGATSAANVGVGAVYNNKPPKQPKNKDGTAKNAVDMKGVNLLTGGSLKR